MHCMIISDAALAPVDMQSDRPLSCFRAVAHNISASDHVLPTCLDESQIFLRYGALTKAFWYGRAMSAIPVISRICP